MSAIPPGAPRTTARAAPNPKARRVLVTGGTGYIGSHTCVCLQAAGLEVLIVDDLSNSELQVVDAIGRISGRRPLFECADVREPRALASIVDKYRPDAAIHFAGVKSVAESARQPLKYYDINVGGSLALLKAMARHGPPRVVFSSSATVYGEPQQLPLREDHPLHPESAYGRSKMMVEMILTDICAGNPQASVVALRYFNPAGAHASGNLGDSPRGIPENLMPYLGKVAAGEVSHLSVFGNNYPTPDGTCIRDYVHVMDLAEAHVAALSVAANTTGYRVVNIGTGVGVSVLQLIEAYASACGHPLRYQIAARRAGDVACYYADAHAAQALLDWRATRGLRQMCEDAYRHVAAHQLSDAKRPTASAELNPAVRLAAPDTVPTHRHG